MILGLSQKETVSGHYEGSSQALITNKEHSTTSSQQYAKSSLTSQYTSTDPMSFTTC
jgi:hypothetical protein